VKLESRATPAFTAFLIPVKKQEMLALVLACASLPTPPAGWRTWNQFGGDISQELMESMMDRLTDRSRMVDGKPTSLLDLGYSRLGMDDNWQACGTGINGSFHDAAGNPLWNTSLFPDVKAMNAKAHTLGLKSDWYLNNCICGEKGKLDAGFVLEGNARALVELGFDGTKFDGCGQDRNVSAFMELVEKFADGARPITMEDCNDDPDWDRGIPDASSGYSKNGCSPSSGGGYYR
jgi:alpha-galactosidase